MLDGLILHFYPRERILVNCKSKEKALEAYSKALEEFDSWSESLVALCCSSPIIKIILNPGTELLFSFPGLTLCGFSADREINYE